jgi:hypothetical protein
MAAGLAIAPFVRMLARSRITRHKKVQELVAQAVMDPQMGQALLTYTLRTPGGGAEARLSRILARRIEVANEQLRRRPPRRRSHSLTVLFRTRPKHFDAERRALLARAL